MGFSKTEYKSQFRGRAVPTLSEHLDGPGRVRWEEM
jgi:hypothetical protein